MGPVHVTTTKVGLPDPLGLDVFASIAREIPAIAIGGITAVRVRDVRAATPGLRVIVAGGGIVGLACAEELVRAGHDVSLFDPSPGSGATYAAAGMLAPGGGAWFGEEALSCLGVDSLRRWPAYAATLEERSGHSLDLRAAGTLLVGADRDDLTEVRRTCSLLEASDVRAEELDRRTLRRYEPTLSGRLADGALLPGDCHVNPRRVACALLAVLGDRVVRARATAVADGVVLADGTRLPADVVVLASGAVGMPHVRPVRGEVVRVRSCDAPTRVLRALVCGERCPRRGLPRGAAASRRRRHPEPRRGRGPDWLAARHGPEDLALAVHALGPAVVLTGGDPGSGTCRDVVVRSGVTTGIEHPAVMTANDHGTGCTYSAALAVHGARGLDLETAARRAQAFVARALATSATWQLGSGRGPVAHVFIHPHEEN